MSAEREAAGRPALSRVQRHLQDIYRTEAPDIGSFLVGEGRVREVIGGDARPADEWVLVREAEDALELAVYVDAQLLDDLDGTETIHDALARHFRAWCAATEGVSHFLLLVERARRKEPVSMLELEAQAEVDKYVRARLCAPQKAREWRSRLFDKATLADGLSHEETARYREAGRLAAGFCRKLDALPHAAAVLAELRSFWRRPGAARMEEMRRAA